MLRRKTSRTIAALALALACVAVPGVAYAGVFDDVVKDYRYMASEGFEVPEVIEEAGGTYELAFLTEAIADPAWERPTSEVSHSVTISIPAADLGRASSFFEEEIAYSEEGFEGTLSKVEVTTTPEHEVLSRQVDRTVSYTGLPDNDVSRIAKTREFAVSAAYGTQVKALELSDVTYEVEAVDEWGLPTSYTAYANYRGLEEYLTTPGYTVTCVYEGTAELVDTQMLTTATYSWTLPWWASIVIIVLLASVAAAAARLIYVLWWKKKRAMVWKVEGDKETLLECVRIAQTGNGSYCIDIPADIRVDKMTESCHFEVEIPERYLESNLRITQNELVLFDDVARHRRIRVLNPFD